jgi:hypothetical protein
MMKKFAVIIISLFLSNFITAQSHTYKVYNWSEVLNADPDTIYGISFSKNKLDSIPYEIIRYKNLKHLNLEKNKLTTIPDFISKFEELNVLILGKNKLQFFPNQVLSLSNLTELQLSRNEIDSIPDGINQLIHLERLDLWSCPITYFSNSLYLLKELKTFDIRGVTYGPTFIKELTESLNWTKIEYDTPCSCVE